QEEMIDQDFWDAVPRLLDTTWDTQTREGMILPMGHAGLVSCVAMTPDGSRVVAGAFDGWVKVWDVATGKELVSRAGDRKPIAGVAFDGERIVIRGTDGTQTVWEPSSGNRPR